MGCRLSLSVACKAPSTEIEAMVARASSGVTSWAMVARPKNVDVQHLAGAPRRFEILAAVIPQPEVQALSDRGLLDDVCVTFELVADGRPDEIGPVRIEPFLHHQIDVTEVDIAKIDRDFLGVGGLWVAARAHCRP